MSQNKFKIGDWICDQGDQSLGAQIVEINENELIAEIMGFVSNEKIIVDADEVEMWHDESREQFIKEYEQKSN
jgi:hypothetical protein